MSCEPSVDAPRQIPHVLEAVPLQEAGGELKSDSRWRSKPRCGAPAELLTSRLEMVQGDVHASLESRLAPLPPVGTSRRNGGSDGRDAGQAPPPTAPG